MPLGVAPDGTAGGGLRHGVLLLADSQDWEAAALTHLRSSRSFVVSRRCLDVADLMALAATGEAALALVAGDASGFDVACVAHLAQHGVAVVAVVPTGVAAVGAWTPPRGTAEVVDSALTALDGALRTAWEAREATTQDASGDHASSHSTAATAEVHVESTAEAGASLPESVAGGRVIGVWGPVGSPGRTTVALALAGELAARGRRTTLLDVDPWGGTVGQHLGILDEVSGLLAASRAVGAGTLTASRLEELCVGVGRHLRVLTGLPAADRWPEVGAGAVEQVLEVARARGDVVVDCGSALDAEVLAGWSGRPPREHLTTEAVAAADLVVMVATPDPVGLTRLVRGAAELASVRPDGPDLVVLNRVRSTLGWSVEEVTDLVRRTVPDAAVATLPDDRASVDRALAEGALLTESGPGPLRAHVRDLVEDRLLAMVGADAGAAATTGSEGGRRTRLSLRRAAADRRR